MQTLVNAAVSLRNTGTLQDPDYRYIAKITKIGDLNGIIYRTEPYVKRDDAVRELNQYLQTPGGSVYLAKWIS